MQKQINKAVLFLFMIVTSIVTGQNEASYSFNVHVNTVYGDLNKDGRIDVATVTQDTLNEYAPYKLDIFFQQLNGDLKLITSSIKAIEPQFPNGRESHLWGNGFGQLSIHNGVLWIETGFIRGHMEHKFRYQNNKFELIGYSYANVTAGQITIIDYNLSTGKRIEKEGNISDDDYKVTVDKIIKLNPLPSLDAFEPYLNDLY